MEEFTTKQNRDAVTNQPLGFMRWIYEIDLWDRFIIDNIVFKLDCTVPIQNNLLQLEVEIYS